MSTSGRSKPFVEQVGCKQHVDSAILQVLQGARTVCLRRLAAHGQRWDAGLVEGRCHELSVRDAHAEAERAHGPGVEHLVSELGEHDGRACVVARVNVGELVLVVPATSPADAAQIRAVGHRKVVERAQQIRAEGIPEAQLRSRATAEEGADVHAVSALRRCRQSEQLGRREVVDDAPVGHGLGMVKLIDHHDVEGIRRDVRDPVRRQRLHAREDMLPAFGPRTSDVQLAKVGVCQHLSVRAKRLLEDLAAVGDEQEAWSYLRVIAGKGVGSRGPR